MFHERCEALWNGRPVAGISCPSFIRAKTGGRGSEYPKFAIAAMSRLSSRAMSHRIRASTFLALGLVAQPRRRPQREHRLCRKLFSRRPDLSAHMGAEPTNVSASVTFSPKSRTPFPRDATSSASVLRRSPHARSRPVHRAA